jgi:hypothetical protein
MEPADSIKYELDHYVPRAPVLIRVPKKPLATALGRQMERWS